MNETTREQPEAILKVIDASGIPAQIGYSDAKPLSGNENKSNGQSESVMDEKAWERVNARRGDLIRQKYTASLTHAEQAELDALEEIATRYLNVVAPLSDYPLDVLQVHIDRIKANQKNGS